MKTVARGLLVQVSKCKELGEEGGFSGAGGGWNGAGMGWGRWIMPRREACLRSMCHQGMVPWDGGCESIALRSPLGHWAKLTYFPEWVNPLTRIPSFNIIEL